MAKSQAYEGTPEHIGKLIGKLPRSRHYRVTVTPEEQTEADTSETTSYGRALAAMSNRTPQQIADARARAISDYPPRRTVPPGMTLADIICGKWPGDESDEQINKALEELS